MSAPPKYEEIEDEFLSFMANDTRRGTVVH